jgi:Flp pilus assembly pilin Flp
MIRAVSKSIATFRSPWEAAPLSKAQLPVAQTAMPRTWENAMSKRIQPARSLLVGLLSVSLLFLPVQKASAGLVEYALILVLIAVIAIDQLPPGSRVLIDQLETSIEGAQAANMVDNRIAEANRLSKASGAAEALLGMTSACSDCSELRDTLQQIIGQAAALKTAAVGASGSCHPNGTIQPNEECDPLAESTGCPVDTIELTYCSDECRCVPVIAP